MEKAPGANCDECPLKGQGFAPSEYAKSEHVRAFIISRSPGHHDTAAGRPFAGPSGKVLDHLLKRNDVSRADIHTTNVVLCETESLDGAKGAEAIRCCRPRLERELAAVKTDTYIAAGAEALSALSEGKLRLRSSRGQRIKGSDGKQLVATYNPAAALRDDVVFPDLVSDFRRAFTPERDIRTPEVTVAGNVDQALQIIDVLRRYEDGCVVAVDIESTGLSYSSKLLSIGFSPRDTRSFVIGRRSLEDSRVRDRLLQYLSLDHYKFLYHNGKFDVKLLRSSGVTSARVDEDTLLLSYLCDERPGVHSLDYLVQNELDWPNYEPATVAAGKKYGFSEQPVTRQLKTKVVVDYEGFSDWTGLYKYNGYDTAGSRQLFGILSTRAQRERTTDVYRRLLIPASNCLADVEAHGVVFDVAEARRIEDEEVTPELSRLHEICAEAAGFDINLNSPKQVSELIYDRWNVTNPLFRRGKDRSVDAAFRNEVLRIGGASSEALHFLRHMDRFKKLDKLRGTYLGSLAARVDADGRLRCDFLLHGTESGRLSSRNPNFQNIPRGGKDGLPNIRSLFVASPGRVIVQADYSQAELRTIAITSGDENLLDIYRSGKDLHTEVATELFGENFTKEQRVLAKNYNFGIAYGQGAFTFSQMYHMSKAQAERDIGTWWSRFPGVWDWTRRVHKETRATGELMSAFGRKRRFPLITRDNLDHTLKEAVNFMIQSTASDFTVASLIRLMNDGELDLRRCYPIVLVHDSIVLEAESDYAKECGDIVREVMETTPTNYLGGQWNDIPFDADVQVGENWGAVA